jgi:hypothetical protein
MKRPLQLHAAAATIFVNALCYLFIIIPTGVKSHALISGYRGVVLLLAIGASLYVYPRIARWFAAILFLLSAIVTLSMASRRMDVTPLFGSFYLVYAALSIYLFYQLVWGTAIKVYVTQLQAKPERPPNQSPLQTPGSGTPAADAPVAPPPSAAGL